MAFLDGSKFGKIDRNYFSRYRAKDSFFLHRIFMTLRLQKKNHSRPLKRGFAWDFSVRIYSELQRSLAIRSRGFW